MTSSIISPAQHNKKLSEKKNSAVNPWICFRVKWIWIDQVLPSEKNKMITRGFQHFRVKGPSKIIVMHTTEPSSEKWALYTISSAGHRLLRGTTTVSTKLTLPFTFCSCGKSIFVLKERIKSKWYKTLLLPKGEILNKSYVMHVNKAWQNLILTLTQCSFFFLSQLLHSNCSNWFLPWHTLAKFDMSHFHFFFLRWLPGWPRTNGPSCLSFPIVRLQAFVIWFRNLQTENRRLQLLSLTTTEIDFHCFLSLKWTEKNIKRNRIWLNNRNLQINVFKCLQICICSKMGFWSGNFSCHVETQAATSLLIHSGTSAEVATDISSAFVHENVPEQKTAPSCLRIYAGTAESLTNNWNRAALGSSFLF